MVLEWIMWIFGILHAILIFGAGVGIIIQNKQARFPNRFTPTLFIIGSVTIVYILIKYMP